MLLLTEDSGTMGKSTWHNIDDDTSRDHHRIGLNVADYPTWRNYAWVLREVFERMPLGLQDLCRHRFGHL